MGMPARKFDFEEVSVEERLGRLELNVEHIQSDVAEMKADLRRLNDKVDGVDQRLSAKIDGGDQKLSDKIDGVEQKLSAKIDAVDQKLSAKIDAVDQKLSARIDAVDQKLSARIDSFDQKFTAKFDSLKDQVSGLALTMEKSHSQLRIWAMTFYISGAGALLTFLAHSLHWF
jgi:chromosome segregation ATPase